MKWQRHITKGIYILLVGILVACGSTKEVTETERANLEKAVTTPAFTIEMQWAYPLSSGSAQLLNSLQPGVRANGNRIYIADAVNYIAVKNDSVFVMLPYFGTRQISGGLPGNVNIQVAQALDDWEARPEKKDNQRSLHIATKHKGESYDISIRLFAKGKATVVLNTSQRQSIKYEGRWESVIKD
jgi:hypothetical protein